MENLKQKDIFKTISAVIVLTDLTDDSENRLNELESLCTTVGIKTVGRQLINVKTINPATYIGSGQLTKLKNHAQENNANLIVFNESISPRIQRNLEKEMSICVVDRQEIILQIFANRAQTREARLQVELAQLQYSLPRLSRKWANLSQQRGGVRGSKGSGEKQLELDKRTAQNRINKLKKEIDIISKQRGIQRRNRTVSDIKQVAVVGYTNSGKSTFLNRISNAGVLAEDKLFATLDTTTRKIFMPDSSFVLFTDTVGFVSDLPHELVDSFRSKLEEASLADALLIMLDASDPRLTECYKTTVKVLEDLNANEKKHIVVLNKMDMVEETDLPAISSIKVSEPNTVELSVISDDLMPLMNKIVELFKE